MNSNKKVVTYLVLLITIFVVFLGFLEVFALISLRTISGGEKASEVTFKTMVMNEYNPSSHTERQFLVHVPERGLNDEIRSSYSQHGTFLTIAPFSTDQYECLGRCHCENFDFVGNRRSSAAYTLPRTLMFLISALTAVAANDYAKDYFDQECREEFMEMADGGESMCNPNGFIYSSVDECKEKTKGAPTPKERNFMCEGYCIHRADVIANLDVYDTLGLFSRVSPEVKKKIESLPRTVDCGKLSMTGEVKAFQEEEAALRFAKESVSHFCVYRSTVSLEEGDETKTQSLCTVDRVKTKCVLAEE